MVMARGLYDAYLLILSPMISSITITCATQRIYIVIITDGSKIIRVGRSKIKEIDVSENLLLNRLTSGKQSNNLQ